MTVAMQTYLVSWQRLADLCENQWFDEPASRTAAISSGKVSKEWPGMNQVVLMSYLANNFNNR